MPSPPVFERAPRRYPELAKGEIEIPAPPQLPARPSFSLLTALLPAGATLLGMSVMIYASVSQGSSPLLLVGSSTMMLASYSATFVNHFLQKRAYRKRMDERHDKYRELLRREAKGLEDIRDRQQVELHQTDPNPEDCLDIVERRDPRRLWARAPEDDDFLTLRLGVGQLPFGVKVKPPKQQAPLEPDPLVTAAQELALRFANSPQAPIGLPLREAGAAGLAGPRAATRRAARALAIQIATHHSPYEVKIVAVYPAGEASEWDWLRWLPHAWSDSRTRRFLAQEKEQAHELLTHFYDVLNRRRLQRQLEMAGQSPLSLPYLVFFMADTGLIEGQMILPLLLHQGSHLGALSIFLADRIEALPKGCEAMAAVGPGEPRLLQRTGALRSLPYTPDAARPNLADYLSRTMAPIQMKQLASATAIPTTVPLLDALGVDQVEELDILKNWRSKDPYQSMAVPVGKRAGGELQYLDLHEPGSKPDPQRGHGPNGLVAGKVGFGKSELLLSLITGMAANFHPHEVVFVLLDFKGGGMANAVKGLPHVVNSITNLEIDHVPRALASLEAELERRERLFEGAGVSHIDDYISLYRRGKTPELLPYLVLIVDEFTVLKDKQPEEMRRFVMVAVKGRALGFRMILATQKPAGVVSEQIDANTRFRLCLPVQRPEDSAEMIKRPDAASLTRKGQCFIRVGEDEVLELFQSAWSGAPYSPAGYVTRDPEEILKVQLDGSRQPLRPTSQEPAMRAEKKQIEALIAHVQEKAEGAGIRPLRGPWLPPLPDQVVLQDLHASEGWDGQRWHAARTWLSPVVGLLDDPIHQQQGPLQLDLSEGHVAVYGAPGSGKTTFVQTLVTALALTYSPQDVHMYLLDFGGRLLKMFEPLPHVGDVVLADDEEKLARLQGYLLRIMDERKNRFAAAGVGTLGDYRAIADDAVPAIVVILDNYGSFDKQFPNPEDLDSWIQILREGGNLGIRVVLTANRPTAVKHKIISNITIALAYELTDPGEYSMVVGRTRGSSPAALAGRGLLKGRPPLEFQTALPTVGNTEGERTKALKGLIQQMAQAWDGPAAPPVPMLPDEVAICELVQANDTWPPASADTSLSVPVGLDVDNLAPVEVDLWDGPHFLITGPLESGKTTFLQSWLLALAERFPPEQLHLYLGDFRRDGLFPLQRLPHVQGYVTDDEQLGHALAKISDGLEKRERARDRSRREDGGFLDERAFVGQYPALLMAIDDFDVFNAEAQPSAKDRLERMIRRQRGLGFHVLLSIMYSDLGSAYEGWVQALKELKTGFLFGTSRDDAQVFNLNLPYAEKNKMWPPGQGYYARRRRYRPVRAATCHAGQCTMAEWVERIVNRKL